jgi:hypothetical protein
VPSEKATKRAAILKEAKAVKASGGDLSAEHTTALDRESRRLEGQKKRYSEAKSVIATGKEVAPSLKASVKRVSKMNTGLVERTQRYKDAPTMDVALKNTPITKFSSEMADLVKVSFIRMPNQRNEIKKDN